MQAFRFFLDQSLKYHMVCSQKSFVPLLFFRIVGILIKKDTRITFFLQNSADNKSE